MEQYKAKKIWETCHVWNAQGSYLNNREYVINEEHECNSSLQDLTVNEKRETSN